MQACKTQAVQVKEAAVTRYESFMARIASGECILTDGATGTEAERRGIPQLENAWNGGGALSHPDIIRQIHRDYLDAGAEVVISNSFATHRHALVDAGEADRFEDYNRRAVELAVEARDMSGATGALVGAGMSYWSWTDSPPLAAEMRRAATRQAEVMAAAGADVIMLDEPTAGMSHSETDYIVELIRKVTQNKTLVMVEHDMGVVFGLADQISVLVYGEIIATGHPEEVRSNPKVQEAYLGAALEAEH